MWLRDSEGVGSVTSRPQGWRWGWQHDHISTCLCWQFFVMLRTSSKEAIPARGLFACLLYVAQGSLGRKPPKKPSRWTPPCCWLCSQQLELCRCPGEVARYTCPQLTLTEAD